MSLLYLLSHKNKKKRIKPEILETSFEDLLKDYSFEDSKNQEKQSETLPKEQPEEQLETHQEKQPEPIILKVDIYEKNNSDVEEDSIHGDSENDD